MQQEKNSVKGASRYAVAGDFCRICDQEMNRLYLLSLLLAGDPGKAEQCFVLALEDCVGRNQVFSDWAKSWARRAIIENAIRIMHPSREQTTQSSSRHLEMGDTAVTESEAPFAAVVGLKAFERFVFVMSVLERYSVRDCRILLECPRQEVARAKSRALEHIAKFGDTPSLPAMPRAAEAFAQAG